MTHWSPPADGVFPAQLASDYKYIGAGIPEPYAIYERDRAARNQFRNSFYTRKVAEINTYIASILQDSANYNPYLSTYYPGGTYAPASSRQGDYIERHSATYDGYYVTNGLPADSTALISSKTKLTNLRTLSNNIYNTLVGLERFAKDSSYIDFRSDLVAVSEYDDNLEPILIWVDANTNGTIADNVIPRTYLFQLYLLSKDVLSLVKKYTTLVRV